jgi:hypothetical protein
MIVAVTLAVAPGGETPFSRVKTGILAAAAIALLLRAALFASATPASLAPRILAGLWLGTLALSGLLGPAAQPGGMWQDAAAGLVLLSLLQAPPEPAPAHRAIAGAGTVLALVAVLQALGWDPFGWMGWSNTHPGERMRVYGTLGNPDFVAAYLGASLCITVGEGVSAAGRRARWAWIAAAVLQLGALAVSRSWGSVLALGAVALSLLWIWRAANRAEPEASKRRRWRVALGAVLGIMRTLITSSGSWSWGSWGPRRDCCCCSWRCERGTGPWTRAAVWRWLGWWLWQPGPGWTFPSRAPRSSASSPSCSRSC